MKSTCRKVYSEATVSTREVIKCRVTFHKAVKVAGGVKHSLSCAGSQTSAHVQAVCLSSGERLVLFMQFN